MSDDIDDDNDDITAIQWVDLLYAATVSAPMLNTGGAKKPLPPRMMPWLDLLRAMPFEERIRRVTDQMVAWRVRHDGLRGWRMGADGKWTRVDE